MHPAEEHQAKLSEWDEPHHIDDRAPWDMACPGRAGNHHVGKAVAVELVVLRRELGHYSSELWREGTAPAGAAIATRTHVRRDPGQLRQ